MTVLLRVHEPVEPAEVARARRRPAAGAARQLACGAVRVRLRVLETCGSAEAAVSCWCRAGAPRASPRHAGGHVSGLDASVRRAGRCSNLETTMEFLALLSPLPRLPPPPCRSLLVWSPYTYSYPSLPAAGAGFSAAWAGTFKKLKLDLESTWLNSVKSASSRQEMSVNIISGEPR